jgi:hypothetical protein
MLPISISSMSIVLTPPEIELFRTELAGDPDALNTLTVIEDCDGDLEDAAISLAIRSGQQPDTNERWIDGLAKRWRHVLCEADLKEALEDGFSQATIQTIVTQTELPIYLAIPVAIYVIKTGLANFCQPLEGKLDS